MKKALTIILAVSGCLFANTTQGLGFNNAPPAKELLQANIIEGATTIANQPDRPGKGKGLRRMRSKVFKVNVFNRNKRIRERLDKENKKKARTTKNLKKKQGRGKKPKHILLQDGNGGGSYKGKRGR
jgi:hypothetical protein